MIDDINNLADRVASLRDANSSLEEELANLANELDGIKVNISPSGGSSSSASTMVVTLGATTLCSFGIMPSSYMSIRFKTLSSNMPMSNITDSQIGVNILPFGGCSNPANPTMSVWYFPWICVPLLSPFIPTSPQTMVENVPATTMNSKSMCTFATGGVVSFLAPGQINVKTG